MRRPEQKRGKNIVGRPFSVYGMLSNRHLAAKGREVKITKNPLFVKSNKMLECKLKLNRREGKENVKHKPAIQKEDRMEKLKSIPFLSFNDFAGLLRRVWFIVTLFWCRRGCESQRQLKTDSFRFMRDAEGHEYAEMVHSVQTKNHQGGISEKKQPRKPHSNVLNRRDRRFVP